MLEKAAHTVKTQDLAVHHYIALTTYRKSGAPVTTPVWFVLAGERLFIWTAVESGKTKRLRRNPHVQFAPSDHGGKTLGPAREGTARFVPESEWGAVRGAVRAKYGWQESLFSFLWRLRGQPHLYIEIVPELSG